MFDFIKEKLMGVAVDNLDLSKLATSAMEMINSKPKEEVAKATEQAFDSLDQSKKTTLMDGIFGFLKSSGITGQQTGVTNADASKASGLDFSKIFSFLQSNPALIKNLLNSDLLKNDAIKGILTTLFTTITKALGSK